MRKALNENPVVQVGDARRARHRRRLPVHDPVMGGGRRRLVGGDAVATAVSTAAPATTAPRRPLRPLPRRAPGGAVAEAATEPRLSPQRRRFEAGAGLPSRWSARTRAATSSRCWSSSARAPRTRSSSREIDSVAARGDTTVFVVESSDVARYSRITEGVDARPRPGPGGHPPEERGRGRPSGRHGQLRLPRRRERRAGVERRPLRGQAPSVPPGLALGPPARLPSDA